VFPVEIGLRDPRSQKRDLGHPSISPFDFGESRCFVISLPIRLSESAARDDKGEGGDYMEGGGWTEAFFVTLDGPQAHDSSGRDDNFVLSIVFRVSRTGGSPRALTKYFLQGTTIPKSP
jgi:hypothetical protein